ncbi:MAG: heavy metal-associated domain-containing protein [bacterium]|nr:heavy metal-associated domain-containing protein [bacterium]
MTTFYCEDMMCDKCVARIHKALDEAKLEHSVDLAAKTVQIDGCEKCAAKAAEILDDLGFTPVKQ